MLRTKAYFLIEHCVSEAWLSFRDWSLYVGTISSKDILFVLDAKKGFINPLLSLKVNTKRDPRLAKYGQRVH